METATRQQLIAMSSDFYRFHAESFDQSRQRAWHSWQQTVAVLAGHLGHVLDLGCGNGRFLTFLCEQNIAFDRYLGVDSERHFIRKAELAHPPDAHTTFVTSSIEQSLQTTDRFDTVACFGVLHHVPGAANRTELIRSIGEVLEPGGHVILSLWQPKQLHNFDGKTFAHHGINDLEPNDYLLGWNGDFTHLRYCHHFDDAEIQDLIEQSGMVCSAAFSGSQNDRTNRYVILRKH